MDKSNNQNDYFFKYYKAFFFCTSVLNKLTGEEVKVTGTMFEIYTYMLDQYLSYKSEGLTFHENQLDICKKLRGMTPKTFRANYNKLKALGLVSDIGRSSSCGKYKSYEYTIKTPEEVEDFLAFSYAFDIEKNEVSEKFKPEQPESIEKELESVATEPKPKPKPKETEPESNNRKLSFADELDHVETLPVKDTPPAEPKTYPWGSSKVFQSNGSLDLDAWDWALRESNKNESSALALMIKTTSFDLKRNNIPGFSIAEDEEQLPF